MKVKEKFKVKEVRAIEKLLSDNADMTDDKKTAEVLSLLCNEDIKPEAIPEMDEIELVSLIADFWLYKKKLNEHITAKLTASTPE